jgi:eukaryotic-like serine/threonine-protein kinase
MQSGNQLGPYEILSAIGAGGMGEVYRARDTRLDRIVAIKVLPVHLADRPELRERFEHEARTIASLNHPHICTLHDVGHQDGTDYLVMEYLEGETLAQRLTKGPLPLNQALQCAIEIADALDKAHRKGVTHRDLKPGNIMLTKSGTKLLDFGLAKLQQEVSPNTSQYMAPEQLEGKEVDARTDVFAFGTVVYETATGKKAFEGKSQASVIAKILETDPPPISSLQPMTPPALDRVVKKCLVKEPDDRWQSARDVADELKWIAEGGSQAGLAPNASTKGRVARWRLALPWAVAALLLVTLAPIVFIHLREQPPAPVQLLRYHISPPEKASFGTVLAVSPDGRHVAFTAREQDGRTRLWVRDLDTLEARPLPGTEDATDAFWSRDSRVLGFESANKLERVDISGGAPQTICDVSLPYGESWSQDGIIVFGSGQGMMKVSAGGGTPSPLTKVDASRGEIAHGDPSFLPDGRRFLYVRYPGFAAGTYVGSLDAGPEQQDSKRLFAEYSRYVPALGPGPGHILFVQNGALMAQTFDASRMDLEGDPVPIAQQVASTTVSANGILAYAGGNAPLQLTWFDRQGKVLGTLGEPGVSPDWPAISPDGSLVVVPRHEGGKEDLWLYNLARGTRSRLTFDGKENCCPVWSPDGSHIALRSNRDGSWKIYQKPINGIGQDEVLDKTPPNGKAPRDWSRDGRYLIEDVFSDNHDSIWVLPLSPEQTGGDRKRFPYVHDQFNEARPKISPNGQWLAYASYETGRLEIYVQTFPKLGGKWPVSINGGTRPVWSRDGKELYFIGADGKLMAVDVKSGPSGGFEAGTPKVLFDPHIGGDETSGFDVSKDGRFLIAVVEQSGAPITVVVNWTAGLNNDARGGD